MADFFWPSDIVPASQSWRILDNAAAFVSAFTGATQTIARPGGIRIGCTIQTPPLRGADRHRILALLSAMRGRENRVWLPDFALNQRGSFPSGELISNTSFTSGTAGWTSSNAEVVLSADSGRLRLARTGTTADRTVSFTSSTTSGATYLFRAGIVAGRGTVGAGVRIGTTAGGAELGASANLSAAAYAFCTGTASGTTTYPAVLDRISGRSTGGLQFVDTPSFARCALVNGAGQTGAGLLIDALPASTNGLLVAGDVVAIYSNQWELKRLRADLNSDGTGAGWLMFDPPLRASPADNAPVAIHAPRGRFLLASEEVSFDTAPGHVTQFQIELVEDVVP